MLTILRQTDSTERAGDQSSVRIDKQICPLLYTWGCTGILDPPKMTCAISIKKFVIIIVISIPSEILHSILQGFAGSRKVLQNPKCECKTIKEPIQDLSGP